MKDNLISKILGCGKRFEDTFANNNRKAKFICGIFGKRLCQDCRSKLE